MLHIIIEALTTTSHHPASPPFGLLTALCFQPQRLWPPSDVCRTSPSASLLHSEDRWKRREEERRKFSAGVAHLLGQEGEVCEGDHEEAHVPETTQPPL